VVLHQATQEVAPDRAFPVIFQMVHPVCLTASAISRATQERQHLTAYARDRRMAVAQHVMQIAERAIDRVRLGDGQVEREQHTQRRGLRM
jgi:hypothetical protein